MALRDVWRSIAQKIYDWLHPDEEPEGISKAPDQPVHHTPIIHAQPPKQPELSAYERAGLAEQKPKRVEPRKAVISPVVTEGKFDPSVTHTKQTVESDSRIQQLEEQLRKKEEEAQALRMVAERERIRHAQELDAIRQAAEQEQCRLAAEQKSASLEEEQQLHEIREEQERKAAIQQLCTVLQNAYIRLDDYTKAHPVKPKAQQPDAFEVTQRHFEEAFRAAQQKLEKQEHTKRMQEAKAERQRIAEEKKRKEQEKERARQAALVQEQERQEQLRQQSMAKPVSFYPEIAFTPTKLIYTNETPTKETFTEIAEIAYAAPQSTDEAAAQSELLARVKEKDEGPTVLRVATEKRVRTQRTKTEELAYINALQDQYIAALAQIIDDKAKSVFKETNLTSPTGTGKTKMMVKLINSRPDWYFVITTPSHGQLHKQIEKNIVKECHAGNFKVYGVSSLTANSKLKDEGVLRALPKHKKIIWLRDEGHRKSNNWMAALENVCYKIVNISATNIHHDGIVCNFSDTMMLRTVQQHNGTPEDTLRKLMDIKAAHKSVKGYNPCALFRLVSNDAVDEIIALCKKYKLKYLSLINYDDYDMSEICEDDNEIDVLLYRQKLDMGIDIRRAHVIYIENSPNNASTIIQSIGRCRRNAMFWRQDVDILAPQNKALLHNTRQCHVFFGNKDLSVETDENGELCNAFCPYISVQKLRPNSTVLVQDGVMSNGLMLIELAGCSGEYHVTVDPNTGFNVIDNPAFYATTVLADSQLDDINEKRLGYLKNLASYASGRRILEQMSKWKNKANIRFAPTGQKTGYRFEMPAFYPKEQTYRTVGITFPNSTLEWFVKTHTWFCGSQLTTHEMVLQMIRDKHINATSLRTEINEHDVAVITPYIITYGEAKLASEGKITREALSPLACQLSSDMAGTKNEPYRFIYSNHELSVIGAEMYSYRKNVGWIPNTSVTSLLGSNTKFHQFIAQKYAPVIEMVKPLCTSGRNEFDFDKRQNSCLGFCVEYYAKMQIFKDFMPGKFDVSTIEGRAQCLRACMDMYKSWMAHTFGDGAGKLVTCPSVETLGSEDYEKWCNACVDLGTQTVDACRHLLKWKNPQPMRHEPSLISKHITGLADILTKNTIIDIKVTNHIDLPMILQVLAYHYLSTLRNTLEIDRAIVYDATSNIAIVISGLRTGRYHVEKVDFGASVAKQYEVITKKQTSTKQKQSTQPKTPKKVDITDFLDVSGVTYVDRRPYTGALWLIGGLELQHIVDQCAALGTRFRYKPEGGTATKGKPGWWTK